MGETIEHETLRTLWTEFGISPDKVGNYSADWIHLQLALVGERKRAEIARMERK